MTKRYTRLVMGMPVTVEIVDAASSGVIEAVFDYFTAIDRRFSTYKVDSEISACNRGDIAPAQYSSDMREVLALAERTKAETGGFFEIRRPDGCMDPSGIVKGWAVRNAANIIRQAGFRNFYVDAGGDIEASGHNGDGESWRAGIRNPFNADGIVNAVALDGCGIATSGSDVRGQHIYDPHHPGERLSDIVSLTVIGPDVLEADRFATAAFAMGADGIYFIEYRPGLEGYAIDAQGIATQTSGFGAYVIS